MSEVIASGIELEIGKIYNGVIDKNGSPHRGQPFIVIKEIGREEFIGREENITSFGYLVLEDRNYFYEISLD